MSNSTTVLEQGKKRIEKYGWTQFSNGNRRHGFCVYGAITAEGGLTHQAYLYLQDCIGKRPVDWNDEKGRTKEEVLELFDKAIELSKEKK